MIRKILFLLLAAVLPAGHSLAADLPARPRLASPVVDVGWSGMYWGIHAGYNLGSFSPFCNMCGPEATAVNLDDNSPFVGGHMGYLVQAGNFIVGPEVGVQYWGFKSKADKDIVVGGENLVPVTFQQKIDWLAYANVRLGFSPTPKALVYLTGGAAWAHSKAEIINLSDLDTSTTQSVLGFNIGGGIEYKLSEYLSLRGEYRHYDFGKVAAANPIFALGLTTDKLTVDQASLGFSYRLN